MAREPLDAGLPPRDGTVRPRVPNGAETSLGELFRQLTTDTGQLIRQEVNLAKVEMRQAGSTLARDGTKIGIAAGLALAGVFAFTAFAILGLGAALDNYWLSALIVAVLYLVIGGVMGRNAVADIKRRGIMPDQTAATLRDDARWAKEEAKEFKRELTR